MEKVQKNTSNGLCFFIFFISLIAFSSITEAGVFSYECIVKKVYDVNDAGILKISVNQSVFEGSKFSVSRQTGDIVGETLTTIRSKNIRVINFGSKEYSFKTVAEFEGQVQLLEIQEFREGNEKPFVASSMGGAGIVTGICR